MSIIDWLFDAANWSGEGSIPYQLGMHLLYSAVALIVALAIAVPLGVFVGHTGKGKELIVGFANAARALPTLGLVILLVLAISPHISNNLAFVIPALIVLILLAIPPILSGTVSGIQTIDPAVIDAARGMGYSTSQIIRGIEFPNMLPLMLSGIRAGTLQIVSTATVAAYVSLDGLGRFILDGRAGNNYSEMAGGAVLVALVAALLEILFTMLGKFVISPGLQRQETPARRTRTTS